MKGEKAKIFGLVMALVLAVALAGVGVNQASAEPDSSLRWSDIPIPDADDLQLYPDSDVGPIAVTPDGETLFAAVFNESDNLWSVFKSTDGGYTWKETGFSGVANTTVAVEVSPNWETDNCVFVATNASIYWSNDRGKTFRTMTAVPDTVAAGGTDIITSMDVGLDENLLWTVVVGTYSTDPGYHASTATSDVYLWVTEWVPQQVDIGMMTAVYGVLDVALSPNYAADGRILAVVNAHSSAYVPTELDITILRTETQAALATTEQGNWGAFIADASFRYPVAGAADTGILASRASLAFADDFNGVSAVFVGLTAYDQYTDDSGTPYDSTPGDPTSGAATDANQRGDVFRVDFVTEMVATSTVTDLNVRGTEIHPGETNIWSLDISGDAASAFMLAGVESTISSGPLSMWSFSVHYSANGGASWMLSYKPPPGLDLVAYAMGLPLRGYPIVVMAPDFAESGIAYCGTGGGYSIHFTGFSVSTTQGTTWNGRGLLDYNINEIMDIAPSPSYATDQTLFVVTYDAAGVGNLWETTDGGTTWDLIYSMNALLPPPGVLFTKVELPPNYPTDPSIFLTGPRAILGGDCRTIICSTDEGNNFVTMITAPAVVTAWDVVDRNTIFIGDANGNVYRTTDASARWDEPGENEIPVTATVIDIVVKNSTILVGTNQSEVYICYDESEAFEFVQVGSAVGAGTGNVSVAFDANYDENDIIYAGLLGGAGQIWRFDLSDQYGRWEQINDVSTNVSALKCTEDGVLYAIDDDAKIGWRSVYPTASPVDLEEKVPLFERLDKGLEDANDIVYRDLEVVLGSNMLFSIGEDAAGHPAVWAFHDTLIKPLLDAPADDATTGTILEGGTTASVVLSWNALEGAERYQVQVARDELFGTVVDERDWTQGTVDLVDLSVGTPYYWRVRVASPNETYVGGTLYLLTWEGAPLMSQWSEPRSFTTVLGPAEEAPTLESPIGGTAIDTLRPSFGWIPVSGATGYEFQVATTSDFSTGVIVDKTGADALGLVTAYQPTTDLEYNTTYFWHVKAIGTGTESPWSAAGSFTTMEAPEVEATPAWVWVVIALSVVLLIAVIVLIVRTRRLI